MSGMLMGVFVLTVRLTQTAELPTNIGLFSEQNPAGDTEGPVFDVQLVIANYIWLFSEQECSLGMRAEKGIDS